MLARLAESLYWVGRYIERAEHIARYLKVQYFSTMDSPVVLDDFFARSSLLKISGSNINLSEEINEREVLLEVAFNTDNPSSLIDCIIKSRENAKSIRPTISNEVWENVNSFYYFIKNYDQEHYATVGLNDFVNKVLQYASMFKQLVDSTLLHDESWAFIRLGIHVERSYQITRIMLNKLFDINYINSYNKAPSVENYQWLTTLKIFEGLDMSRRVYNAIPNRQDTCEFLISNTKFPRSIAYNMEHTLHFYKQLTTPSQMLYDRESIEYKIAKLWADYRFVEMQNIGDLQAFLETMLEKIILLNNDISNHFFRV